MIIVHETFVCKPGNASKLAKKFKEMMEMMSEAVHVLTDITGQFNRVIIVSQYESLAAYESSFEKYSKESELMKKMEKLMEGYTEMYQSGSREIYKVW